MVHQMRLHSKPFAKVKKGTKTVELRLYDEKRRTIKVGDTIEFISRATGEVLKVIVVNIHLYSDFTALYQDFDPITLGYEEDDVVSPDDMSIYYSSKEQATYGVVGIEIKLI